MESVNRLGATCEALERHRTASGDQTLRIHCGQPLDQPGGTAPPPAEAPSKGASWPIPGSELRQAERIRLRLRVSLGQRAQAPRARTESRTPDLLITNDLGHVQREDGAVNLPLLGVQPA